jgi:putative N6-adenine-specific DNA methylase
MIPTRNHAGPLVATCGRGFEEILADELRALGAAAVVPGRGMATFSGDLRMVYDANLCLRTAARVLVPLVRGQVRDRGGLYELAGSAEWDQVFGKEQTFAVEVAGRSHAFRNTAFAAQVVKDAVVDELRRRRGRRPNVDRDEPDVRLHLHLSDGATSVSLDSSGEPLGHRGYRPHGGPAPLAEHLAAGILLHAGYDGSQPLLDPMCGTGTFAIEAALIASHTAPGLRRAFAFERWPFHDHRLFEERCREFRHRRTTPQQPIVARDRDGRAVSAARQTATAAWVNQFVSVECRDVLDFQLPWEGAGMIVTNPPYGKRMGEVDRLRGLYRRLGDQLKKHAVGSTAWLLVGNRELANELHLRTTRRIPVFNGPVECRLLRFDLFEGALQKSS